jgi:hypothetical protein
MMKDHPGDAELLAPLHFVETEVIRPCLELAAKAVIRPISDTLDEPEAGVVCRRTVWLRRAGLSLFEREMAFLVFETAAAGARVVPSGCHVMRRMPDSELIRNAYS